MNPTQRSFSNKHTEQAPIYVKLCSRDFQKSKQTKCGAGQKTNISIEMKLASSPLNQVKQKNISLGVDSDHYKQKGCIWQKQIGWGQQGGLKTRKPVRTKYLNWETFQFPETPGFAERKRKQENNSVNQNH